MTCILRGGCRRHDGPCSGRRYTKQRSTELPGRVESEFRSGCGRSTAFRYRVMSWPPTSPAERLPKLPSARAQFRGRHDFELRTSRGRPMGFSYCAVSLRTCGLLLCSAAALACERRIGAETSVGRWNGWEAVPELALKSVPSLSLLGQVQLNCSSAPFSRKRSEPRAEPLAAIGIKARACCSLAAPSP